MGIRKDGIANISGRFFAVIVLVRSLCQFYGDKMGAKRSQNGVQCPVSIGIYMYSRQTYAESIEGTELGRGMIECR